MKAIALILFLTLSIVSQQVNNNENKNISSAIEEAKAELKGSDIGVKLELWHAQLKANNVKLKLLFDDEGFILMLQMISLGKRLTQDDENLADEDIKNIISFISALERIGGETPAGLREQLTNRLGNCAGRNWRECINLLKSTD